MESDCESSCLPPISSGSYVIINKANGNIKVVQDSNQTDEYPVVANAEAQTWLIEHLGGHDYHIFATQDKDFQGGPAVDSRNLLFVVPSAIPEVWVICGEYEGNRLLKSGRKIYIIKKKEITLPQTIPNAWELESSNPGTQVQVVSPLVRPGTECLVKRVPEDFTWYIEPVDSEEPDSE